MGIFNEVYNYSRNFNLPLEIVIEDNATSVYTKTKGLVQKIKISKDVFYYKYN